MRVFNRSIEPRVREWMFKRQMILIFGPRQAGKTTFAQTFLRKYGDDATYFNCEQAHVRKHFEVGRPELLEALIGDKQVVVFDEAQTIHDIGAILKVYWDTRPNVQLIATGSSSFDLANKINEPLTGRAVEFTLPPLSLSEIHPVIPITRAVLDELLVFGSYPAIVDAPNVEEKTTRLLGITTNYLYKDVYMLESLRNPKLLEDLLHALAGQIGNTVSIHELAETVGANRATVERYLRLLEQAYVIFRLHSFSRNSRNELKKAFKVYFIDVGIRNAVLGNLSPLSERSEHEKGVLFENFFVAERYKKHTVAISPARLSFWRTRQGLEIDLIEEGGGVISAFECKWKSGNVSFKTFLKHYPDAKTHVVSPDTLVAEFAEQSEKLPL